MRSKAGLIGRQNGRWRNRLEQAVVAVQLAQLTNTIVPFFTALGHDEIGEQSVERLRALGVNCHVAWREGPSRRGISLVDHGGDRAITVIGERHTPRADDPLPWEKLNDCDGVFVSATNVEGLNRPDRPKF